MDRVERRRQYIKHKGRIWRCSHCSKKRPGQPKLPRGACYVDLGRSPKRGRNRWRLDLDLFE